MIISIEEARYVIYEKNAVEEYIIGYLFKNGSELYLKTDIPLSHAHLNAICGKMLEIEEEAQDRICREKDFKSWQKEQRKPKTGHEEGTK